MASTTTNSLRKAAILVDGLDPETVNALFSELPAEQATQLLDALQSLGEVQSAEREQVYREFLRDGQGANESAATVSGEREPDPSHSAGATVNAVVGAGHNARPFEFLRSAPARDIAARLQDEGPQTMALVIAYLPPETAAEVLAHAPPTIRADIVARLAQMQPTSDEFLAEIEQVVRQWFAQGAAVQSVRQPAGLDAIRGILTCAGNAIRRRILDDVARTNVVIARQLGYECEAESLYAHDTPSKPVEVTIDDLADLADQDLAKLLSYVDARVVILALTGSDGALANRLLDHLPHRQAIVVRHALEHPGPTRLSDVESARNQLTQIAQQLLDADHIELPGTRRLSVAA